MNKVNFYIKEVSWIEAKATLSDIRQQVFVKEQKVPQDMELDEHDTNSNHLLACDTNGIPVGTARLLPDGHIGRMAVLAEFRGQGIGSQLLTDIIGLAKAKGLRVVTLHAQTQAVEFYKKHRFHIVGKEFMEAGIAHVEMQRQL
jgi:predicted GNAT family N-acyltransferase